MATKFDKEKYWEFLRSSLPSILSQLDRDADSPTFGSFDRNFWHYKIRDFSSIILQQGMMVLDTVYRFDHPENNYYNKKVVKGWIEGSMRFWADSQLRSGSFNEYYPYENAYPPAAFSLYAVGHVVKNNAFEVSDSKVLRAMQKTVNWLLAHPEKEALNQEAAGLAGLAFCSRVKGLAVDSEKFEKRLEYFYSKQTQEGWFPEYGGPDIGYLAVTIDCLWDIYETLGDERALHALENAVAYIALMVSVGNTTAVMINSRNTDYCVPYGMVRNAEKNPLAAAVVKSLFSNTDSEGHFLRRTDDRYSCHYVYQSCFRSLPYLEKMSHEDRPLAKDKEVSLFFKEAGIYVYHKPQAYSLYVYLRKGGIVNLINTSGVKEADFGWRAAVSKNKVAVTHWLEDDYSLGYDEATKTMEVEGKMSQHGWMKSSPPYHIALRTLSFLLGRRLIPLLKKLMIFGSPSLEIIFKRRIKLQESHLTITDSFSGSALKGKELRRAPHYSLRHVASAGLFVPEELIDINDDIFVAKGNDVVERKIMY